MESVKIDKMAYRPKAVTKDMEKTSTMAPDVGQPFPVDDEVILWQQNRRSDRDTGLGSLRWSTELQKSEWQVLWRG